MKTRVYSDSVSVPTYRSSTSLGVINYQSRGNLKFRMNHPAHLRYLNLVLNFSMSPGTGCASLYAYLGTDLPGTTINLVQVQY